MAVFEGWNHTRIKALRKRQDYKDQVHDLVASARMLKCLVESDDSSDDSSTEECCRYDWRWEIFTLTGEDLRQYRDECGMKIHS